ncbi:MAG: hypothetical protein QM802_19235 [Agriterribacter sp.]
MSRIWYYIEPWIDKQRFAFTTYSVIVGCLFLYLVISKHKVASQDDLLPVNGTLLKYSFVDGERGEKRYYLWLKEYSTQAFQVPADFVSFFQKTSFENTAYNGQPLALKIAKFDQKKLNKYYSTIFIYELKQGDNYFLSSDISIEQENSPLFYYVGAIFIIAGIGFYFLRRREF